MQLTKEDVIKAGKLQEEWESGQHTYDERLLNFSKLQQVVKFYSKYVWCEDPNTDIESIFEEEQPKLYREFKKQDYAFGYWLFNYCFKDGLK